MRSMRVWTRSTSPFGLMPLILLLAHCGFESSGSLDVSMVRPDGDAGLSDASTPQAHAASSMQCPEPQGCPASQLVASRKEPAHPLPATSGADTGAAPQIACGDDGTRCDLAGQTCCLDGDSPDGTSCQPDGVCGQQASCDGPEDCGGDQVCCGQVTYGFLGLTSDARFACAEATACEFHLSEAAKGVHKFRLCHADSDCEAGDRCAPNHLFGWWGSCR